MPVHAKTRFFVFLLTLICFPMLAFADTLSDGMAAFKAKNYKSAFALLQPLAEHGNAMAQYSLGWMYAKGEGVPRNVSEAVKWFHQVAALGNAKAQAILGFMYERGRGVPKDNTKAVKWYRKAASQGDVLAQYNLGFMYFHGQGVAQNYIEALKWFRKSAEQGYVKAQIFAGHMYFRGQGVSENASEAAKWLRKAADQGNANAQTDLGVMYRYGLGVPQNDDEASSWLHKAAEQGNTYGRNNLLSYAAKSGNVDEVKRLLAAGVNVNARDAEGFTPLLETAFAGNVEMAKVLISAGADVNAEKNGDTPLYAAAMHNSKNLAELLIANGANVNAGAKFGDLPIDIASQFGYKDMVALLIDKGSSVNSRTINGFTPLDAAVAGGRVDVAKFLIAHGADVNAKTSTGWTPLQFAAYHIGQSPDIGPLAGNWLNGEDLAVLLIVHGADAYAKNDQGKTSIDLAAANGNKLFPELYAPAWKGSRPSFGCGNKHALTFVESEICALPLLRHLDRQLADAYSAALKTDDEQNIVKDQQRSWLHRRNEEYNQQIRERSLSALVEMYNRRISELKRPPYENPNTTLAEIFGSHRRPVMPNLKVRHPLARTHYLGRYAAYPVQAVVPKAVYPASPGCKALVKNFNQFRNVPFGSNNPQLSPRYPQFYRPHWTPAPWNRVLAKTVETGFPGGVCPKYGADDCQPNWRSWLRNTRALRRAHIPVLWRTTIDLLGNGEHETLIRLRMPPAGYGDGGSTVFHLPPSSYSPYIDNKLYMLPLPHPQMARGFNGFLGWEWATVPTDIIGNTDDKKHPFYVLSWSRSSALTLPSAPYGTSGIIGVVALTKSPSGGQQAYHYVPLGNIAWIRPVHVYAGPGPGGWPRLFSKGQKLRSACAQVLPLAQSQFDSDAFYLYGPPPVPPGYASTFALGPVPGNISGGGIQYNHKLFRTLTNPAHSPNVTVYWQKTPSLGRRFVLIDEPFNWEGDWYALLSIAADTTPAHFWTEFSSSNRFIGPQIPGMITVIRYGWRPPAVFSDNHNGHMWAIDVGASYFFLGSWQVHPLDATAAHSPCTVQFGPPVANAVSLLPAAVGTLASLLDRALGSGQNEGTLHPTGTIRSLVQTMWANVLLRPWALTNRPYNTRAQVDTDLRAWSMENPRHQRIYEDLERQYPLAEHALSRYYRGRFHKSEKTADILADRALDIAFRSYFVFPPADGGG